MPTARTASSNSTCLLPEPNRSQTVLLFLHTPQASPAVPSKEPEQEGWAGKQAGRKGRDEESRGGPGEGEEQGRGAEALGAQKTPKNSKKSEGVEEAKADQGNPGGGTGKARGGGGAGAGCR